MSALKTLQQQRTQLRQQVLLHLQNLQIPYQLDKQSVLLPAGRLDFAPTELQLHPDGKASRYLPYPKVRLSHLEVLFRAQLQAA